MNRYYIHFYFKKLKFIVKTNINSFVSLTYPEFYKIQTFFFLRKNKTFIKSKYSRSRQWSKVIVYFGLWYGIVSVFFLMAYCYRFLFIFSYIWWLPTIIILIIFLKNFKKNKKYFYFF